MEMLDYNDKEYCFTPASFRNPYALIATRKGMQAVNLCCNKILWLLPSSGGQNGCVLCVELLLVCKLFHNSLIYVTFNFLDGVSDFKHKRE